jgi:hypothetical protein
MTLLERLSHVTPWQEHTISTQLTENDHNLITPTIPHRVSNRDPAAFHVVRRDLSDRRIRGSQSLPHSTRGLNPLWRAMAGHPRRGTHAKPDHALYRNLSISKAVSQLSRGVSELRL